MENLRRIGTPFHLSSSVSCAVCVGDGHSVAIGTYDGRVVVIDVTDHTSVYYFMYVCYVHYMCVII